MSKYFVFDFLFEDALSDESEGEYSITIDGVLNSDRSGSTTDSMSFDIYLDNTAPEIDTIAYDEKTGMVNVTASDNYGLYYAEAIDGENNIYDETFELVDGVYTASLDVSELNDDYVIYVFDFAYNYETNDDTDPNAPEGDKYLLVEGDEYYDANIFCKKIEIANLPHKSTPVTPVLAIYDKDGKLLKTVVGDTFEDFTITTYTFKVKLTEPNFPDLTIPEDATTKLFLWDTISGMHPLEFTLSDDADSIGG
jgi:hypothetical protein